MDKPKQTYVTNEQAQATTRVMAAVLLVIGWAGAYWVWPSGITAVPLAAITFGQLLLLLAAGVIALVTLGTVVLLWND